MEYSLNFAIQLVGEKSILDTSGTPSLSAETPKKAADMFLDVLLRAEGKSTGQYILRVAKTQHPSKLYTYQCVRKPLAQPITFLKNGVPFTMAFETETTFIKPKILPRE
jgi:hypothetical protein